MALAFDHSEYWWINGGINLQFYRSTDYDYVRIQITLISKGDSTRYDNKYHDKLLSVVKTITDASKKQNTVFERIKYIHDYLISYTDYG